MTMTTISSRSFNQDSAGAKRAAELGPVFITDRGEPSHVLLSIATYRKLSMSGVSALEMISMGDVDDMEFDPSRLELQLRVPDLG